MNQAVICIAPDVSEAEREVETLRRAGFTSDDISVLWPDLAGAQELGYEHHTKAPEGIAWGALFGAAVGALTSYLIVTGMLWTPFAAQLTAAGMPVALFAGVGAGGICGFLLGAVIGIAFPEYEAKKYERKIKVGSTLVAVHTDSADEVKMAEKALKTTGALGIHHIEERARCKAKSCATIDSATKISACFLVVAALSAFALSARADEVTSTASMTSKVSTKTGAPISKQEKIDEIKTQMPPDVTSTQVTQDGSVKIDRASIKTKSSNDDGVVKTKIKVKTDD